MSLCAAIPFELREPIERLTWLTGVCAGGLESMHSRLSAAAAVAQHMPLVDIPKVIGAAT